MESINEKNPLFKKFDLFVFEKIDKFKKTPNYNFVSDFYNSLDEEQQKALKISVIGLIILLPTFFIFFLHWQNTKLKDDLNLRTQIISKANQIIGQKKSLEEIRYNVLSQNPIDSDSMMTSKLSQLLSNTGIDLSKIQVKDFKSEQISSELNRSEGKVSFNNLTTDELMNLLTNLIQIEKFKISSINISRNSTTNLLQGYFEAIHLAQISLNDSEE